MTNQAARATFGEIVVALVLVICALTTTGLVAHRELKAPTKRGSGVQFAKQDDWKKYAAVGHRLGDPTAPAVLVEFADFQCPACGAFEQELQDARKRFPNDLVIVYRHLPLVRIHKFAMGAAVASECAGRQSRFAEMHDALYASQDSLGVLTWAEFARRANVSDLQLFSRCLSDSTAGLAVERDVRAADTLKVAGTPTVILNGVKFSGVLPRASLDSLIETAIRASSRNGRPAPN